MNAIYKELSKPFQREKFSKVIDYNWVVDGILKNSMPYETQKEVRHQLIHAKKRKRMEKYRNHEEKIVNPSKLKVPRKDEPFVSPLRKFAERKLLQI